MEDTVRLKGYHNTSLENAYNIISEKYFYLSKKNTEWLGCGIYFWDEYDNAVWWSTKQKNPSHAIIIACIKANSSKFLDLDQQENMDKLVEFARQFNEENKHNNMIPNFKNNTQIRQYYCTGYKKRFDVKIMKYTFKYPVINCVGFPTQEIERVQLCLSDNETIADMKLRRIDYAI
ncbi:hypothetical protein [Clostridium minihomine]|uniref:hypothetical protein n=1 Tax=Clostridium minihomine TaxID=2045012 RepID=UPI000C756D61|nr:hypothetical protein [Clostridium minihomine]